MNWIFLLLAGLFEVSLAFCLGKTKTSVGTEFYCWGAGFLLSTVLSMYLLAKAVQTLPIGTAYAVWTGIGGDVELRQRVDLLLVYVADYPDGAERAEIGG